MIDEIVISIRAGQGGDGAISFLKEKYRPKGGPDGGNGGHGGNIIVVASEGVKTLLHLKGVTRILAENGGPGRRRQSHGSRGTDYSIEVPVGTLVWVGRQGEKEDLLADLSEKGSRIIAARGGGGGRGNLHYCTPTNQIPLLAEGGVAPERLLLRLEMNLLSDVGVVGPPNAGKSSLLCRVSAARPKVAPYPFTTLEPVLAEVETRGEPFVLEEVPGLMEGAHRGKGLGRQFLRHAERSRLLLYLLDGTSLDVPGQYRKLRTEVDSYSDALEAKPRVVAVNKVDLPEVRSRITEIQAALGEVWVISAETGEGVDSLVQHLAETVEGLAPPPPRQESQPQAHHLPNEVLRLGPHTYEAHWPRAQRLVDRVNLDDGEVLAQLHRELRRLGVTRALEDAGIQAGDTARIGKGEFEWMG